MKIDLTEITESVFEVQTITICQKFREAAIIYLEREPNEIDKSKLLKQTDALLFKFTLSVINLEFLWRISEKQSTEGRLAENEKFEWNNSNSIIDATFFESTIIQIRAFIDFAQKLACVTLGYNKQINGTKDFYKNLNKIGGSKSNLIKEKFSEMDKTWGKLIRSLRNKIVHYDLIKTNHEYRPTVKGKNYEVFAQELTNNMFLFLVDLCKLLFEIEWVSGTFNEFKKAYAR
ncbi:hypothetical protein [Pseudozobellia thermophila]|uniref:Cthe-2314-like HEPN domain-containing protein n=1 Tax=Pseudozobellia thermophila TaxID=192903 RepID=A0A1M6IQ82_9FLAO|nr:hypothetical protein [Pseudozobellia thermophila]SHJ36610.1 hypothetical protein SAMN04488513_10479 [Pseudozobellia thermophila]